MVAEVMAALQPKPGGRYVDGTLGGGGHTRVLLESIGPTGMVLGLDQDPVAIENAAATLGRQYANLVLRRANFSDVDAVLTDLGWPPVDGLLVDLGVSSWQLEGSHRGFSFALTEPLDMRMDPDSPLTADKLVNKLPEKDLADLIYQFGEERASRGVARAIVQARQRKPLATTRDLAEIVRSAVRAFGRPRLDPATRTFQALRLVVNRELEHLEALLNKAPKCLAPGGRLVAISFHSLEDRLVKRAMVQRVPAGTRPEKMFLKALYKKPLRPSLQEAMTNPRARSAKLRAGEVVMVAGVNHV